MSNKFLDSSDQSLALEIFSAALHTLFPKGRIVQKKTSIFGFECEFVIDHPLDTLSLDHITKRYQECLRNGGFRSFEMVRDNAIEYLKHEKLFDLAKSIDEDNQLVELVSLMGYTSIPLRPISENFKEIRYLNIREMELISKKDFQKKARLTYHFVAAATSSKKIYAEYIKDLKIANKGSHLLIGEKKGYLKSKPILCWEPKGLIEVKKALEDKISRLREKFGFFISALKDCDIIKKTLVDSVGVYIESAYDTFDLEEGLFALPIRTSNVGFSPYNQKKLFKELETAADFVLKASSLIKTSPIITLCFSKDCKKQADHLNEILLENNLDVSLQSVKSQSKFLELSCYKADSFKRNWLVATLSIDYDQNCILTALENLELWQGLIIEMESC